MPPTDSSSLNSGKHDALPLMNSDNLRGFIKYMGVLASCPESQFASAVLGEIDGQRAQVDSKDEEVKELQKKIIQIEEAKRTTIKDMFTENQNERAKQNESATQIKFLEATIKEKERNIAELSRDLEALQQEIGNLKSAYSQEVAKVSQSAKDISTLQVNLKEKEQTIDQMKTVETKFKSVLSSEQNRNKELEAANASMNSELQAAKVHLQKLEDFPVQSSEINADFVMTKFTSLWTSAIGDLLPLLEQDVTEDILKEKPVWEKLKKAEGIVLPPNFPLIPTNSPAAKAIRLALILTVLFREIDQCIFQPSYFLAESDNLRGALEHLAKIDVEKEAFFRRVLLSIDPNAEHEALKYEIRAVVQTMSSYAGALFSEAQHDLFRKIIKTIAQNAADFWLPIQRSRQKFETDFEPHDPEDNEWDRFPSAGDNTSPVARDLHGLFVLNVFPCISLVEDGDHDPLTKVIQLRSSQELYLAAQHEANQIATSTVSRRGATRPRRQSIAGSNGRPFLEGNPTKV